MILLDLQRMEQLMVCRISFVICPAMFVTFIYLITADIRTIPQGNMPQVDDF